MRIGLLSDTHGHMDDRILHHLEECDEIWHAGDIGTPEVSDQLSAIKPYRAVYGNIDGHILRRMHPKDLHFEMEGFKIWMTHIGGRPGRYGQDIRKELQKVRPDIFICGHSHILKVQRDPTFRLMYLNPGAAGIHGFHKMRTLVRFNLDKGFINSLEVVELGPRSQKFTAEQNS